MDTISKTMKRLFPKKEKSESGYRVGEYVYVVNWGGHYSSRSFIEKCVKTDISGLYGPDFYWKNIYKDNITKKGTINKREPKILVERLPVWKNFKYKIVEITKHINAGESYGNDPDDRYPTDDFFLMVSDEGCMIMVNSKYVSRLTPEQFADKEFNAVIEANLGKWSIDTLDRKASESLPKEIISKMYDKNDRVLFGSVMTRGLITYHYLDGKFTVDGVPLFISLKILYDGKGTDNAPEDAKFVSWDELKDIFKHNRFGK